VSAALKDGMSGPVTIYSEKERPCTVENPWPERSVRLTRNGTAGETVSGRRFTVMTAPGEALLLEPEAG